LRIPAPKPKPGYVVIEVTASGRNHAEMRGEIAEAN